MAHNVQPICSSSLEPLEPRLLLSADPIGVDLAAPLQTSLGESAIHIDLNQQDEQLVEADPSLILTYLASTDLRDEETGDGQLLVAVAPPVETDAGTTATLTSETVGLAESGVQITAEPSALAASLENEQTGLVDSDQTDGTLASETQPIETRGPPAADCVSVSNYPVNTYNIETESFDSVTSDGVLVASDWVTPELPGLYLVDADPANLAGQVVYLDFDGEAGVRYDGPVTIGPFDVPAFQAPGELAGQEQLILADILAQLEQTFAGSGVIVTIQPPDAGTDYSTVYVGGDNAAFLQYGSFLGIAEQVDEANCDDSDNAFVFSECTVDGVGYRTYGRTLAETISHEVGHLLGYAHLDAAATSPLSAVASVEHPHLLFDPINAYEIDPSDGNSIIEAQDTDEFLFTPMASGTAYFVHDAEGLLSGIDLLRQQASTWVWVDSDGGSGTSFFAEVTAGTQYKLVVSTVYSWVDIGIHLPAPITIPVQLDANGSQSYDDVLEHETTGHYYRYFAPAAGTLVVDTSTSAFEPDTDLFVFDENGNMTSQSRGFDDGFWSGTVEEGSTYYFLVRQNLDEDYADVSYSISFTGPSIPAPSRAVNPYPENWATNQSINVDLSWWDGGGATSYDVYFGTDSTPDETEFVGTQTGMRYDPGTLAYGTTYHWRIDARNMGGVAMGNVWSFTTPYQPQDPPSPTVNPSPTDGASNQSIDVDVSWANGGGATSYDVYFGTDSTPDSTEFKGTRTSTTYDPGTLAYNTTYYWRIDARNSIAATTGNVWSFTTAPQTVQPPSPTVNPSPSQGATNQSIDVDLSWANGGGATSYDVYFGTDSTPDSTEFMGIQASTTYDPGTLAYNTTYYWRIDARNSAAVTTGTVWSFTTLSQPVQPPSQAVNPSPSQGATNQSIDVDLTWTNGGGATGYDVYFGTDSTPDSSEFMGIQAGTTYDPGTLTYSTTYYWRIDARNAIAVTSGSVWSFTTLPQPVQPPLPPVNPNPSNGATNQSIDAGLSWVNGGGATSYDVYFGTDSTPDSSELMGIQANTTYDPGTLAYNTTYYWKIDARNSIAVTTGTVWSFTTGSLLQPEIEVSGNGVAITDGDTSPSLADYTDFGSVSKGQMEPTRIFKVTNTGTGDLTLGSVGVPTGFTVIEPLSPLLAAGASDTFTVRLNTALAGTQTGDVSFPTNDADENPFNFRITGTVQEAAWLPSSDVPKTIEDFETIVSSLTVNGLSGIITDVDVRVNIAHTWLADLEVYLTSPRGTRVPLFAGVGQSGTGFDNTILDDQASTPIGAGASPFTGSYRPTGYLATLNKENPNGTWQLEVTDVAASDTGTLIGWALRISTGEIIVRSPAESFASETDLFDLQNKTVLCVPSPSGFAVSTRDISSLPVSPQGGTPLQLADDNFQFVTLSGDATIPFYGTNYHAFYVGSNGYITFAGGDIYFVESLEEHFDTPRISVLFDDLDPSAGGTVSWKQLSDRVVVTWQDVPEAGWTNKNTFQVEMYFNGRIQLSWLAVASKDCVVGLSDGFGVPLAFEETDFSKLAPPASAGNIATGKTATQSSTGWGGSAGKAIDDNTNGNYAQGSVTHTLYEANAWWQLDLGALYEIKTIEVWNRTDAAPERLADFYVFVSNTTLSSRDPLVTANQAGVWSKHVVIPGGPRPTLSLAVAATGRYIRIQLANTNYLSLAEVKVFGEAVSSADNVARGKTAIQSSTGWSGSAARAVDGNTDGIYAHGSVTHTLLNPQAWWQVDLNGLYQVDAIEIWNRTDSAPERLRDFYVFVSDTPFASADPVATANQPGVWSQHVVIPGGPRPDVSLLVDTVGRYVRIQLANTNYLSLAEVKVFGEIVSSGGNVARGKTATQSSTGWSGSAGRAVDGNTDGIYAHGSVTHTLLNIHAWWQVDLGGTYEIDAIEVWNRTDSAQDRLDDFYVFVSNTPFTSTDSTETPTQTEMWSYHAVVAGGPRPRMLIAAGTQGRYVRIQLGDTNYLNLAEVKVFGKAMISGNNVAQGKTASQSSTGWSGSAGRAVDGNTDGNYTHNSVTHTQYNANAWWQVDLGNSYQIQGIEIWNRTDSAQARLSDFYVFVSATPFASTTLAGTLAQAGVWSQHVVIPDGPRPDVSLAVGTVGRYVRVQLAGTNYLSLAEVKVFGTLA